MLEAIKERLDRQPEMMRVRHQTVEHPFGTIKHWMGWTHFLTKDIVASEYRDEPSCVGIQLQTDDADSGSTTTHPNDEGVATPLKFF